MDSLSPRQSIALTHGVIENYLVIRLIDCDPLTRSYINRVHGSPPSLSFLYLFSPKIGALASARERRLSGVRSANKSNTPRFVQRESSSFTIHEFIMGTTEDTAGPPLLIYRYASPGPSTSMHAPGRGVGRGGGDVRKLSSSPSLEIFTRHRYRRTSNFCEKCILNLNHARCCLNNDTPFSNCCSFERINFDRWGFR